MCHTHVQYSVTQTVSFPQQMMPLLAITALLQQRLYDGPLTSTHGKVQGSQTEIDDAAAVHGAKEATGHLTTDIKTC